MKNKTAWFILTFVGIVMLSVLSSLGYHHYYADNNSVKKEKDSTQVIASDTVQNGDLVFTSIEEVLQDHRDFLNNSFVDSVYFEIPEGTLINVAKVVIGRQGRATVPDIVREYLQGFQNVYQYLPTPTTAPTVPDTKVEDKTDTAKVPLPTTKDTVINGENYKIMLQ